MKLSEAIRLGATLKGQTFDQFENDQGTRTCALGAAMDAIGQPATEWYSDAFDFDVAVVDLSVCPVRQCTKTFRCEGMIMHLNDKHRWKRERIADWVELQEPAPTPEPLPEITEREVVLIGK